MRDIQAGNKAVVVDCRKDFFIAGRERKRDWLLGKIHARMPSYIENIQEGAKACHRSFFAMNETQEQEGTRLIRGLVLPPHLLRSRISQGASQNSSRKYRS